jgi:F-type H+-transporting ATPase subunit delta
LIDVVANDFVGIANAIEKSVEFKNFLNAFLISSDKKVMALKTLFSGKVNSLTLEFLLFLEKKGRLNTTLATINEFTKLHDNLKNVQRVVLVTAFEIDKIQLSSIEKRLEEKLNKKIVAEVKVEPSLIGGFKIKVGDQVCDLSVATQLNKLKMSIVKA